jgi:hypothetical protein
MSWKPKVSTKIKKAISVAKDKISSPKTTQKEAKITTKPKTPQSLSASDKLQKAQKQALQVDKELYQKGISIEKGKTVSKVEPPMNTPNRSNKDSGWKYNNGLPSRRRGKSKGKGMSR